MHPRITPQRNIPHSQPTEGQADGRIPRTNRCNLEAQKFVDRTTIPGVSHCSSRPNRAWRIAWVIIVLAGLVMASIQSKNVFSDFFGDSIVQVITFDTKKELIFPGVTTCSNILYDQNADRFVANEIIQKFVREAENAVDSAINQGLPYADIEAQIEKYRTQVMTEMAGNWSLEKQVLKFSNYNFFRDCKWKSRKCDFRRDFFTFNNLRYGKCMTFNPGFGEMEKAGPDQGFTGILHMNLKSRAYVINPDYAVLVIHPSSLPPVPGLENVIRVHPGDRIRITINGRSVDYRQVKYIKPCIPEEEIDNHANELYFTKATPYKYSERACFASCRFHKAIEKYRCVDPSLPVESVLKAFDKGTRDICNYTEFLSDMDIPVDACNCLKACKEPVITPVATISPLMKTSSKLLSLVENREHNSSFNRISAHHAVIQVVFANTEYMKIMGVPKYTTADFFGMFGGNLSLWLGVNFLCLVELIEFLIILLHCKVVYLCKREANKRENAQSEESARHTMELK